MRSHRAFLAIPWLWLALGAAANAQNQPPEPPTGPWALMLGVPYEPGGQFIYDWISVTDVPTPPGDATGYVNRHWELSLPQPASADPDPALWRLTYVEYDCDADRYRVLEQRRFRDETEIGRTGAEDPVQILPHTIAAFTMTVVCEGGVAEQAPRAADAAEARVQQAAFDRRMHPAG